jgi:uncharacterized protein YndB with AHSA1/START domain
MNPTPTGRIFRTPAGRDLVLTRIFRAPREDVWASITEPERTARWFGRWWGQGGVGSTIRYSMGFEEGAPEAEMTIRACEPPHHLAVYSEDAAGVWHLEAHLTEADGVTELRFTQHLDARQNVGDIGPGWEYYLDNLVASRIGDPLPSFSDYYPAQTDYYRSRDAAEAPASGPVS